MRLLLLLAVSLWSVAQTTPLPNSGATKPVAPTSQPGSKTATPPLPNVGPMQLVALQETRIRLERTGFEVFETPFGWQNEWKLHVGGESLAKVFKEI